MAKDDDRDNGEDDRDHEWERVQSRRDVIERNAALIALLKERQQSNIRRLDALEKKQGEYDKLLNRGLGAIGLVAMIGVFLSWLFSVGGSFLNIFERR